MFLRSGSSFGIVKSSSSSSFFFSMLEGFRLFGVGCGRTFLLLGSLLLFSLLFFARLMLAFERVLLFRVFSFVVTLCVCFRRGVRRGGGVKQFLL